MTLSSVEEEEEDSAVFKTETRLVVNDNGIHA
jgi:hypothetical protein